MVAGDIFTINQKQIRYDGMQPLLEKGHVHLITPLSGLAKNGTFAVFDLAMETIMAKIEKAETYFGGDVLSE